MIDRKNRDKLTATIQKYLNEEIGSFEFDELIFDISINSEDETIIYIVNTLWYFYDDVKDHKVLFTKEEWDYVQRLLLILNSDKEIIKKEEKEYTVRQVLSLVLLIIFIISFFYLGYTFNLLLVSVGLGLLSMLINYWKSKSINKKTNDIKWELEPFSSISELLILRRNQNTFKKSYYRKMLKKRKIRSTFTTYIMHIHSRLSWLVFSPFVLLYQSFPEKTHKIKIK